MALSLSDLQAQLDALITARGNGAVSIEYNGRRVTYRSIGDLNDAITQTKVDIEELGGPSYVRTFRFSSDKDL